MKPGVVESCKINMASKANVPEEDINEGIRPGQKIEGPHRAKLPFMRIRRVRGVPIRVTLVDYVPMKLGARCCFLGIVSTLVYFVVGAIITAIAFPTCSERDTLEFRLACVPQTLNYVEFESAVLPDGQNCLPPLALGAPMLKKCPEQLSKGDQCYAQQVSFQVRREVNNYVSCNKSSSFDRRLYRVEIHRHYSYHCAAGTNLTRRFLYSTKLQRSQSSRNVYNDNDLPCISLYKLFYLTDVKKWIRSG